MVTRRTVAARALPILGALFAALAAVSAGQARASEIGLIAEAVFGGLRWTDAFDVNVDGGVTAADLTARVRSPVPGTTGCGNLMPPAARLSIQIGPDQRAYDVRLPATYDSDTPHPVVFGYHGFGGNAASIEMRTLLAALWPDAIGVYGEGLPRTQVIFPGVVAPGWQNVPGEFADRDVEFFDAVLARLAADSCVDLRRVYASGHSNGGFFSHVLGCTRGDAVAAIGPRSGGFAGCSSDAAVPAIISHGTDDRIVPYAFGPGARASWVERDACSDEVTPYGTGCEINAACAAGNAVAFCPYAGGHQVDPAFPAEMIRFFKEHARRDGGCPAAARLGLVVAGC